MRKPFYGWIIVGVTFLIGITEAGTFQNILSIFMKPMVFEFGWSRAAVTGSIAFGSICGGMVSPFIGPILDRHGPRMVAFWGILFLSIGLFGMMFLSRLWQLYLFFGLGRLIAVGVLGLVVSVSVANWFVRQRGRAMGIACLGSRFGSALIPLFIQFLILTQGWRIAWGILGVVVFLISGLPSLFFLRRRPEDMGLLPDGAVSVSSCKRNGIQNGPVRVNESLEDLEPIWTRSQAIHTHTFWMLTFLHCLLPFIQAGINFHIYPFLTDSGLSEMTAVLVLTAINVAGALGSVIWGIFAEKFHVQKLMAINVIVNGLVFLVLFWVVKSQFNGIFGVVFIFFLAALHGVLHGGRHPLLEIIWAVFFGRHSLGTVYGLSSPFRYTANALGPIFAALCFDLLGSYTFPFYLFAAIFFVSGLVSINIKPPKSPHRQHHVH